MKQCKEACSVPSLWINNTNHHPSLVIYSSLEYLKIQLSYCMAYQRFAGKKCQIILHSVTLEAAKLPYVSNTE